MRAIFLFAGAIVLTTTSSALAQPGAKILTTGSKAERASMTAGVSIDTIENVNLFKGRPHETTEEDQLLGDTPAPASCKTTSVEKAPWRRIRGLRTQGFYSGVGYKSRPYTQGFHSTGR